MNIRTDLLKLVTREKLLIRNLSASCARMLVVVTCKCVQNSGLKANIASDYFFFVLFDFGFPIRFTIKHRRAYKARMGTKNTSYDLIAIKLMLSVGDFRCSVVGFLMT